MFKPIRIIPTIVLFVSIVLCFVGAFVLPSFTCLIFVIVEWLAFLWVGVGRAGADGADEIVQPYLYSTGWTGESETPNEAHRG